MDLFICVEFAKMSMVELIIDNEEWNA
jgi:hypothetical protein